MIIITEGYGQLGNRLILYSNFILFSKEHNLKIFNPPFVDYANHFKGSAFNFIPQFPSGKQNKKVKNGKFKKKFFRIFLKLISYLLYAFPIKTRLISTINCDSKKYKDLTHYRLDVKEFIEELTYSKITFVKGWKFRDRTNFLKHYEALKEYFEPIDKYKENITPFIQNIKKESDTLIGVHIRRGDYKEFADGKFYYSDEVYVNFMKQMKELLPSKKIKFLICSDEKIDEEKFRKQNLDVKTGIGSFIEDLYSLAECDYIIGPPSTYNYWAALYSQIPHKYLNSKDDVLKLEDFKLPDIL